MRIKLRFLTFLVCCVLIFSGCPGDEVVTTNGTQVITTTGELVIE